MSEKYYTVKEVSDLLQVSDKTIRDLINSKEIIAFKVGREWRMTQESLNDYIQANINKK